VGAAIKIFTYFKNVSCNGKECPPNIVRRFLYSFVHPLMEYELGLQYLFKKERAVLDKAWFYMEVKPVTSEINFGHDYS